MNTNEYKSMVETDYNSLNRKLNIKAHFFAFITITIWGTTFISTKLLFIDFSPIEIFFFRLVIAYFALLMIKPQLIKYRNIKEELLFAGAGLCVTFYFIFQNTSLSYTLASNVGVLVSVAPFFTAILSHFILDGEPFHKRFFMSFAISIIGIILIVFNGNYILDLNPFGDILAILSAVAWASYSVITKKISVYNYNVILSTRKIFFYSIIFLIPLLPIFHFQLDLIRFTSLPNLFNMMFLGLGASAICFVTWNYALGVLGAVKTSVYIYINPIITIIVSAIILHEKITFVAMIGVALILVGLYISEKNNLDKQKVKERENEIN